MIRDDSSAIGGPEAPPGNYPMQIYSQQLPFPWGKKHGERQHNM